MVVRSGLVTDPDPTDPPLKDTKSSECRYHIHIVAVLVCYIPVFHVCYEAIDPCACWGSIAVILNVEERRGHLSLSPSFFDVLFDGASNWWPVLGVDYKQHSWTESFRSVSLSVAECCRARMKELRVMDTRGVELGW